MSDLSLEPEMPDEELKEVPVERKPTKIRVEWLDMARGFIVLFMIATLSFPTDSSLSVNSIPFVRGIFSYSEPGTGLITLFDLGFPAFLFILGFTMPISFRKRKEEMGAAAARRYILIRYLLLLLLGFVIANYRLVFLEYYSILQDQNFAFTGLANIPFYHQPLYFIIPWHEVMTIALSGLVGFIFMGVRNPRYRFFLGYGWAILYQFGLFSTDLSIYAENSMSSGIFAAIMGYGSIVIIATAMGDFVFFTDIIETKKIRSMLLFGAINFAITLILSWLAYGPRIVINAFSLNRELVSLPFVIATVGICSIVLWLFYQARNRFKWKLRIFQMFGVNALLLYFITVLPDFIFEEIMGVVGFSPIPWAISLAWALVILWYASFTAWRTFKKEKYVSTTKMSLIFLVTCIALLIIVIVLDITGVVNYLSAI